MLKVYFAEFICFCAKTGFSGLFVAMNAMLSIYETQQSRSEDSASNQYRTTICMDANRCSRNRKGYLEEYYLLD